MRELQRAAAWCAEGVVGNTAPRLEVPYNN